MTYVLTVKSFNYGMAHRLRLFLDSKEPHQNLNIYNYRARKYNKWVHQDYLVVDSKPVVTYFESAFPSQKLDILPVVIQESTIY